MDNPPLSPRKLCFVSGNPRYEVITGVVEFFEDVTTDSIVTGEPKKMADMSDMSEPLVCMLSVPSFMIHQDLLLYLSPVIEDVIAIHILQHFDSVDKYFVMIKARDVATADHLIDSYHGRILSTLQPTTCMIYLVKSICIMPDGCNAIPFTIGLGMSAHSDDTSSDDICPLCLDPICVTYPRSFTTCCNHTFHLHCMRKLEELQCPVCRFQHDAYSTNTACELCESVDIAAAAVGIDSLDTSCLPACDEEDTWVCVVCGFVGCGILRSNHIQSHYEAHLHAYAMNTTTKRVWDFAGEGYVHRLILYRSDDSTNMEHNRVSSSHMKMVEVADPRHVAASRSSLTPLGQNQEDFVVNRKLENVAEHYSGILVWQLEQQRQQFESTIIRLRDAASSAPSANSHDHAPNGFDQILWTTEVIKSLANEKHKLLKQREAAGYRLRKTLEERTLLTEFSINLRQNALMWDANAREATSNLQSCEERYRKKVAVLERKLCSLMQDMDHHASC